MLPGKFKPTNAHLFIRILQEKGILLRNYTQNIDNLERQSGISENLLIEAHGTLSLIKCTNCQSKHSIEMFRDDIMDSKIPYCKKCSSLMKPDIVFFGELLDEKFHQSIGQDFPSCDLLIIMGTSLTVEPVASLVTMVDTSTPRLIINKEDLKTLSYGGHTKDLFLKTDCNSAVNELCVMLGWEKELEELKRLHSKASL